MPTARKAEFNGRSILVLREADIKTKPKSRKERHECPVFHGRTAVKTDNGMIFQCVCGKRYRCRSSYLFDGDWVWVRRLLPWPPKQDWHG